MFLGVVNPLRRAMNICPFFDGDFSNFISIFDYRILYIFLIKNTSNLHYAKFESIQLIN